MKIRYIYSACVVIETQAFKILTDPWFTEGAYYGSWYHYPKIDYDPIEKIGPVDFIYISHIHPDHYDPVFLKRYLEKHHAQIIVGDRILMKRMAEDSVPFTTDLPPGVHIVPSTYMAAQNLPDIDTALIVQEGAQSLVNLNDMNFWWPDIKSIFTLIGNEPDLLMAPYTGAGPWPQCFNDVTPFMAEEKEEIFLQEFKNFTDSFNAKMILPCAGKYILGGKNAKLNWDRGVIDPLCVKEMYPCLNIVIPNDGGDAVIDLDSLTCSDERTEYYDCDEMQDYAESLTAPYAYETDYPQYKSPVNITLDARLLLGLLEGRYNWNSIEVGSFAWFERDADVPYDRALMTALSTARVK